MLTDGFTPWPERPLARTRVVVGLLVDGGPGPPEPPPWTRTIRIDDDRPPG